MNLHDLNKKIKNARNIKIDYKEEKDNSFVAIIRGIINSMDNKKKRITINDVVIMINNLTLEMREGFRQVNARLDRLESDVAQIKQCPTIKCELDELNNN